MRTATAIVLCLFVATGCGESGPPTYEVQGTVTYEGQPLESGSILLTPIDATASSVEEPIAEGSYTIQAPAGEMIVKIFAVRESGPVDPAMNAAPTEQYLHDNYNTNSKLRLTVSPEGENTKDFALNKQGRIEP